MIQILDRKIEEFKNKKDNEQSQDKSNELDEFGERRYNIFINEIVRLSLERNCFTDHEMMVQASTMLIGVSNVPFCAIYLNDQYKKLGYRVSKQLH